MDWHRSSSPFNATLKKKHTPLSFKKLSESIWDLQISFLPISKSFAVLHLEIKMVKLLESILKETVWLTIKRHNDQLFKN